MIAPEKLTAAQLRCLDHAERMLARPGRDKGRAFYSREYPRRCFDVLVRHGLAQLDASGNYYTITDAGRETLRARKAE